MMASSGLYRCKPVGISIDADHVGGDAAFSWGSNEQLLGVGLDVLPCSFLVHEHFYSSITKSTPISLHTHTRECEVEGVAVGDDLDGLAVDEDDGVAIGLRKWETCFALPVWLMAMPSRGRSLRLCQHRRKLRPNPSIATSHPPRPSGALRSPNLRCCSPEPSIPGHGRRITAAQKPHHHHLSLSASVASEKFYKSDNVPISDSPRLVSPYSDACDDEIKNSSLKVVEIIESNNVKLDVEAKARVRHSDGRTFSLNCLKPMGPSTSDRFNGVTLPELLHPMKNLVRVFIATFTCDVSWFLSNCQVPNHLPVTIACHNSERCWSASRDSRTVAPNVNFPNLLLVYPPFPDEIAFGKDRNKQGVACHYPKLIILQRNESLRVIVTSANLVPKQWDYITNTVWWQDFPCRTTPDYSAFFGGIEVLKTDFAAQLAGFVASLLIDVPNEAHWINELAKYDFRQAACHLVASLPGIHTSSPCYFEADFCLLAKQIARFETSGNFLGSVKSSVVGLSHRFHASIDPNGGQLKLLASILRCRENTSGTIEVLLKRILNIPADANAVSVSVAADIDHLSEEADSVQLGFLPRDVAKWLSPLSDIGFFGFSAFVYPKEVLAAAIGESSTKVQLLLYVSEGPTFTEMPRLIHPEHFVPLCLFVASLQRCLGIWRLREVLSQYKWPESLEVHPQLVRQSIRSFFSAFSAATGKKSCQYHNSEESDPEWGCWTRANELHRPSIKILFPTIQRVKGGHRGIQDSRRLLSLAERTWQRLKTTGTFHDCIPSPCERLGYPMHVKVAQRRFHFGNGFSFGWTYVGSHNFSPAAWGHTLLPVAESKAGDAAMTTSRLHICNYELGVIFIVPRPNLSERDGGNISNLDDFVLPFVMPAPRYKNGDRPATAQAMREALAKVTLVKHSLAENAVEEINEDILDEEEEILEEPWLPYSGERGRKSLCRDTLEPGGFS
ncbi:hypothetical protein Cni_G10514 [Canna indica]|uniref:HIRAN domain-containing protein n=1 Tax=Canna indica TaxID=4628 RepID=A0AAQ3K4M6_9LILI|nr:hypothetical protein Cni_G10514 [Canna indica]